MRSMVEGEFRKWAAPSVSRYAAATSPSRGGYLRRAR